jgi:hypothetical protein
MMLQLIVLGWVIRKRRRRTIRMEQWLIHHLFRKGFVLR